jgi:signal transduction histidine kinase
LPEPFPYLAKFFAAFIICCGLTHLNEAVIFYHPYYRFAGLIKLLTAVVSWATVLALLPALPKILHLKTPSELRREVIFATTALRAERRVTQRREEELRRSNQELESFASAVSHDLKAPLRAVRNAAVWIEEELPGEALTAVVKENLDLLKSRTRRMDAMLDALLSYARVGKKATSPERFHVREALENVFDLVGVRAREVVRVEGPLPVLETPRVLFEQVLANLVSNALRHADHEALQVTVAATRSGGNYRFEVRDNGPGIDPRFFDRIFEFFETLQPKDALESVGMGLALVQKIVSQQGGQVTVSSTLGEGATFSFDWPAGRDASM